MRTILVRLGAWLFDHSGPLAPAFARAGEPLYRLIPEALRSGADGRPIVVDGFVLSHPGRPSYHLQMLAMGLHDRDVATLIGRVAHQGMTVIDLGAHVGYFSLLCARLGGPASRVYAFEPSPTLAAILAENISQNGFDGQVEIVRAAASDFVGHTTLYPSAADSMLNSLHRVAAGPRTDEPGGSVATTTVDAWAAERAWPSIDLVKMDIEGGEVAALAGMRELCDRNPQLALIIELNERTLDAAGESLDSFWRALSTCGFNEVSLAGDRAPLRGFPPDSRLIRRVVRRRGNGCINLLCRRR